MALSSDDVPLHHRARELWYRMHPRSHAPVDRGTLQYVFTRCSMSSPSLPQDASQLLTWLRDFCCRDLGVRPACVTPVADFVHDLGMDSLSFVLLVMELEEQF